MVSKGFPMTQLNFFIDKKQSLEPVKLRILSMAPNGMNFLNSMSSLDSVFPYKFQFTVEKMEQQITIVSDILKCKDGIFNVNGQLTWQGVPMQQGFCTQLVRDDLLTDDSGSPPVSIWKKHFGEVESGYSINLRQLNCANLMDFCYLPRYLLKLMHVINLMLQKLKHLRNSGT